MNNHGRKNNFCSKLKIIDILGPDYTLEYEGSQQFKSCQGACVSVFLFILLSVLSFLFGKEIYERKLPTVSVSQEILGTSEIYLKDFPIFFKIQNMKGIELDNLELYYETTVFRMIIDDNGEVARDYANDYKLERCKIEKFETYQSDLKEYLKTRKNESFYCVNFNNNTFFHNEYYSKNSSNINIGFKKCKETSDKKCASEEQLKTIGLDTIIELSFVSTLVDFTNHLTPISFYFDNINTRLNDEMLKRTYLRFAKNLFSNDIGWFVDSIKKREYTYLQSIVPDDMKIITNEIEFVDELYVVTLESPRSRQKILRYYMKLQELLSKIGGLANSIILVFKLSMYPYLRYIYLHIVKSIALEKIDEEEIDKAKLDESDIRKKTIVQSNFSNNLNFGLKKLEPKPLQEVSEQNQENVNDDINNIQPRLANVIKMRKPDEKIITEINLGNSLYINSLENKDKEDSSVYSSQKNLEFPMDKSLSKLNLKDKGENPKDIINVIDKINNLKNGKTNGNEKVIQLKNDINKTFKGTLFSNVNKAQSDSLNASKIDKISSFNKIKSIRDFNYEPKYISYLCNYYCNKKEHYKEVYFLRNISNLIAVNQLTNISIEKHYLNAINEIMQK